MSISWFHAPRLRLPQPGPGRATDKTCSIRFSLPDAQGIPWYFHEIVNAGPQVTAFGIPFTPRKSTFEYEVGVFRSDLEKAPTAGADFI